MNSWFLLQSLATLGGVLLPLKNLGPSRVAQVIALGFCLVHVRDCGF